LVTAFPKRKSLLRSLSLGVLLKKINLRDWLSSLFLVKDVSGDRPEARGKKGTLIAMPHVAYRTRKMKRPPVAEQSCEDAVLRSL
jgi:hypothetical protein